MWYLNLSDWLLWKSKINLTSPETWKIASIFAPFESIKIHHIIFREEHFELSISSNFLLLRSKSKNVDKLIVCRRVKWLYFEKTILKPQLAKFKVTLIEISIHNSLFWIGLYVNCKWRNWTSISLQIHELSFNIIDELGVFSNNILKQSKIQWEILLYSDILKNNFTFKKVKIPLKRSKTSHKSTCSLNKGKKKYICPFLNCTQNRDSFFEL